MTSCRFKTDIRYLDEYLDEITGKYVPYVCHEPEWHSGLCIFHSEEYLKDPKNIELIKRKLTEKIEKSEPLICIGYHLPDLSFEELQFDKSVNFSEAEFTRSANFSRAHFTGRADFSDAKFMNEAYFTDAKIMNEASFSRAQFMNEADFSGAQFTEKAYFVDTKFTNEAGFSGAQFTNVVSFGAAKFTNEAYFTDAKFMNEAYFSGTKFAEKAYFDIAKFTEKAYFSEAQFMKEANFSEAQFMKEANFTRAKINNAEFYKAQFSGKADFSEVRFTKTTYPHLDFQNVQFKNQEHIIFLKNNLSEASFVNTDITRVRFGEDVLWGDESKIREEREIENQLKTSNTARGIQLGDVLAIYRNLRENYEFRLRYDEAGEFFIREMEMKRRYELVSSRSWKNIIRLKWRIREIRLLEEENIVALEQNDWIGHNISLTGLYYHLSKYGESFSRPTIFGIGIILFSTLLFLTQPNPAENFLLQDITVPRIVTIPELDNRTNIEIAFERGLTNFLPSLSFGTELNVGLLDVVFKILGGAVTFGLIIVALRRKFERKFRH